MMKLSLSLIVFLLINLGLSSLSLAQDVIIISRDVAVKCIATKEENNLLKEKIFNRDAEIVLLNGKLEERNLRLTSYKNDSTSFERSITALKEENRIEKEEKLELKAENKHLKQQNTKLKVGGGGLLAVLLALALL